MRPLLDMCFSSQASHPRLTSLTARAQSTVRALCSTPLTAHPAPPPAGSTVTAVLESAAGAVEHVVGSAAQVADNLWRGPDLRSPEERVARAEAETARLAQLMDERTTMSPAEMTQAQVGAGWWMVAIQLECLASGAGCMCCCAWC